MLPLSKDKQRICFSLYSHGKYKDMNISVIMSSNKISNNKLQTSYYLSLVLI